MRLRIYIIPFVVVSIISLGLVAGLNVALRQVIEIAVSSEASIKAQEWAQYFNRNIPYIDRLIETEKPSPGQADIIDRSVLLGDVFQFRLFHPDGTIAMASGSGKFGSAKSTGIDKINEHALEVFNTGTIFIEAIEGSAEENLPDYYAKAFVQALGPEGRPVGVIEVFVDQTVTARLLRNNFNDWVFLIPLICALVYLLPVYFWVFRAERFRFTELIEGDSAAIDVVTGLFIRHAFIHKLKRVFENRESHGGNVGVVLIRVSNIKAIIEESGQVGCDHFLRHVANNIKFIVRESDPVGRLTGTEFAIALPGVDKRGLDSLVGRIFVSVCQSLTYRNHIISGDISIGKHLSSGEERPLVALGLAKSAIAGDSEEETHEDDVADALEHQEKNADAA
ncbi:MAG: GGDEF domain-containing protein [Cohaesibacteraceae bacterium]|nr:GGDEF domain-containing protein [Cohaesibacteraceae bacterium]